MKNNSDDSRGNDLWIIVGRFLRPHWRLAVLGLFVLFVASIGALALPWYLGTTIDVLFIEEQLEEFGTRLIILFLVILLVGLSSAWRFYLMSVLGDRVGADLRKALFANTMRRPVQFFEERQAGDLASRISADTVVIERLVGSNLSILIRNAVLLVGGLVLLIMTSVQLLVLTTLVIPILLGVLFYLGRRVARKSRAAQDATGQVLAKATESYETLSSIRIFGQEALEMARFADRVETAFGYYRGLRKWRAMMNAALTILTFSAIGVVIAKGSIDVIEGTMTGGEMARFVGLSIIVASAVAALSGFYGDFQAAKGAGGRISELLDNSEASEPELLSSFPEWHPEQAMIEFRNVRFAYPSNPDIFVLNGVDFSVSPGETVALVGYSGCGKSTIFKLLLRQFEQTSGEIYIGSKLLSDLDPRAVRSQLALVPQDCHIFSDTALHNIGFGMPGADRDAIIAAAKKTGAHDFIAQLPDGYDSILGEHGSRVSGGQRQRIAVARVLLRDVPILLLDEATSALDSESESIVHDAMNSMMETCTTLIIAHRFSTITNADRLILINEGRVYDSGTHDELMGRSKIYRRLAERQYLPNQASADQSKVSV